jgi:hypothetical protein
VTRWTPRYCPARVLVVRTLEHALASIPAMIYFALFLVMY